MKQVLSSAIFILLLAIPALSFAQSQVVPKEAIETFNAFLQTWLVDQNIDHALLYFDKSEDFSNKIKEAFEVPDKESFNLVLWLRKTLTMWLIQDHESAEFLGHGNPTASGYQFLPTEPKNLQKRIYPQNINEIVGMKDMRMDSKNALVMVGVGLKHAPRDALLFLMKKVGTEWKITFYIWMVG